MARSKKLSRHIARYLGSETAEEDVVRLAGVLRNVQSELVPAATLSILENIPSFLDAVDAAYEKYEENLMVAERTVTIGTEELVRANRSIGSMVNSLGQGFLMFDASGICAPVYSKACETLLGIVPAGKPISAVLRLDEEQQAQMRTLIRLSFGGGELAMSFDEIMHFAPGSFVNAQGAHIQLDYKADRAPDGRVERIVVVATDISEQVRAQKLAEQRKALFESVERFLRDRRGFGVLVRHVAELADMLEEPRGGDWPWENLQREVHTLKGGAGMFRLTELADLLHELEETLQPFAEAGTGDGGVLSVHAGHLRRALTALAARFKDMFGVDITRLEDENSFDRETIHQFAAYLGGLGLDEVRREYLRRVCAEPLAQYMRRYDLVLGDLAARLNKKIEPIIFKGEDIPIMVDAYRGLFESFVHLFRNIADHGIEMPDLREQFGKEAAGRVEVAAELRQAADGKSWLHLDIGDDGGGVDVTRLRNKLMARDPGGGWATCDESRVVNGILTRDISTRDTASLYSGRGIGMGAVHAAVLGLGGTMSVSSTHGKGTVFHIDVPYLLD